MRLARYLIVLLAILFSGSNGAGALDLSLPTNATLTRKVDDPATTYFLPLAPFDDGVLPATEIEGDITLQAWRIEGQGLTTLQTLGPLRDQIAEAGYDILLDCGGQECGGFDFRFNTRVLPAPDMFVDLFDFRFLSARKGTSNGQAEYLTAMVSRAAGTGYVQLITIRPNGTGGAAISISLDTPDPEQNPILSDSSIAQELMRKGHAILPDLVFASGSSTLEDGSYVSLEALAEFLRADPKSRVALVGHTDAVGALDGNIALSRKRAASVLERLAEQHQIPRDQMESNGMGYLSPVAPNLTPEGRKLNRRVEAVLLNTQ